VLNEKVSKQAKIWMLDMEVDTIDHVNVETD